MKIHLVYEGNYIGRLNNKKELYIKVNELSGMTTKEIFNEIRRHTDYPSFRVGYLQDSFNIFLIGNRWFSYLEPDFIPRTYIKKHKL